MICEGELLHRVRGLLRGLRWARGDCAQLRGVMRLVRVLLCARFVGVLCCPVWGGGAAPKDLR